MGTSHSEKKDDANRATMPLPPHSLSRSKSIGVFRRLGILLLIAAAGFYAVFYLVQTPLVFQAERELKSTPADRHWEYEEIALPVQGETTHGWFIPVPNPRGVVLYCHGNGGNVSTHLYGMASLRALGLSVLTFDYGGYGRSSGRPSETRVHADTMAMWKYLTETRRVAPQQIIIWGTSFGGGAACELASKVQPGGVVLESTYLSMAKAAFRDYPWFPASLFLRHRFDNESKVSAIKAPLLVIHSRDDSLYPFDEAQRLFELATAPKQFLELRGDHHSAALMSKKRYEKGVSEFVNSILPPQ